jgi:hypothetical protein
MTYLIIDITKTTDMKSYHVDIIGTAHNIDIAHQIGISRGKGQYEVLTVDDMLFEKRG